MVEVKQPVWVGLDLGIRIAQVCVVDRNGEVVHEVDCAADAAELEVALSAFDFEQLQLIATESGTGDQLVRKLRSRGYPVEVFECRKASKFLSIRRNKTDLGDAKGLADLARLGLHTVSRVHLASPECQQLRSQLGLRQKLVHLRVAAELSVRSRLAFHQRSIKAPRKPGDLREEVEAKALDLLESEGIDLRGDLAPLVQLCEALRTQLKELDRKLSARAKAHPVCQRLMEVPGVGPLCALSFFSAIEDPTRFQRSSDVGAYLGLIPRRYQSGEVSRGRGITKTGNKLARQNLVIAATVLRKSKKDSALKDWALSLRDRVGSSRGRVALARKLAVVLISLWRDDVHFEPYPKHGAAAH